ncbi:Chaperone protein ClpC1 chloroplastic [Zea mays]|uniref:Chaperone protein ClpC1 chloroplastic n=1 Tax=Zea mays TaxID=4577 RepID=A0A1D6K705_MAIZE|nr:Chaperone protein ClpC1 chloroplastic [Zea mays]
MPAVIPASARPTSTNLLCRCPPAHRHPSPAAATDDLPRPPQGGFCKRACRGSYRRARRGTRTRRRPRGCWRTSSPSRSTLGPPTRSFWPRNGGGDAAPSRPSAGGRTNEFHAATLHLPRRRCPPRTWSDPFPSPLLPPSHHPSSCLFMVFFPQLFDRNST